MARDAPESTDITSHTSSTNAPGFIEGPEVPPGLPRTEEIRESLKTNACRDWKSGSKDVQRQDIRAAPFFSLDDREIVRMLGEAFEDELDQLKYTHPTVESSPTKTLGGFEPGDRTPSQLMYDTDYPEINRTVVGLLALKWLIVEDYETFTSQQPPAVKLTRDSFNHLREIVVDDLRSTGEVYGLIVATIINDLGKNQSLLDEVLKRMPEGSPHPNHDLVVYLAAQQGLVPLFSELPESHASREILLMGLELGASLNVAQLAQAENVPASLSKVTHMRSNPHAFALKYLEIILDVAGAQGQIDSRCSLAIIEPTYQSFVAARAALMALVEQDISLRESYDKILIQRADMIEEMGFQPRFDVKDRQDRSLLRLLCMGRATTVQETTLFYDAFNSLSMIERKRLVNGLEVDGVDDGTAIIPYYSPSLFAVTLRTLKEHSDKDKVVALSAIMRFLGRVFRGTRPKKRTPGRVVECDLSFAQDTIKSPAFTENPNILDDLAIPEKAYSEPV